MAANFLLALISRQPLPLWINLSVIAAWTMLVSGSVYLVRRNGRLKKMTGWFGLLCSALLFLFPCLVPSVARVKAAGPRGISMNNLKQIGIALHAYAEAHGYRLPPAVVSGKDGQPLLSWRVLLLPYLDQELLFREFKLGEPWDSPHNLALLRKMPREFAAPAREDEEGEPYTTFYQAFTGKGTAFDVKGGARLSEDFPDGMSTTILVAEAGQAVPWTKPVDLVYSPDAPLPSLGGVFTGAGRFRSHGHNRSKGFHVIFADASVWFVTDKTSEATLRAAITRNGGEPAGEDW